MWIVAVVHGNDSHLSQSVCGGGFGFNTKLKGAVEVLTTVGIDPIICGH